jgi:hypothetical protein
MCSLCAFRALSGLARVAKSSREVWACTMEQCTRVTAETVVVHENTLCASDMFIMCFSCTGWACASGQGLARRVWACGGVCVRAAARAAGVRERWVGDSGQAAETAGGHETVPARTAQRWHVLETHRKST